MDFVFDLGAIIAVLSAVAMAVLGGLVLRLDHDHGSTLAFGAFVLAWAAEITVANLTRFSTDPSISYAAALGFQALLFVAAVPLVVFTLTYPPSSGARVPRSKAWAFAGAPALAGLALMGAQPSLFVEAASATDGRASVTFGPLSALSSTAFSLAMVVGVGALAVRLHANPRPEQRSRLALVLAAFTLYISYRASLFVSWVGIHREAYMQLRGPVAYWVIVGLLGLAFLACAGVLAWAMREPELPWRRLAIGAAIVPFTASLLTEQLQLATGTTFGTVGLWRIGMVAILAYALARYRLFDLEVQLRDAAPVGVYVSLVTVGWLVLWTGFGSTFAEPWWAGVGAMVGIAACCWPTMSVAEEAMDRHAGHLDEASYLYKRKLEVYRSALQDARAEGISTDEEQRFLAELRDRLEISEDEHRAITAFLDPSGARDRSWEDRFTVREELGEGSLGRALLAHDDRLERDVVLKEATGSWLFGAEGRELFLQEARLAAQLNHPRVVQIYEVLPDRQPPTLVLEHVAGGSLQDQVEDEGPLGPERALEMGIEVLEGLAAIHEAGIVHRDIKPGNILLDEEGRAKITDLGVARPPEHLDRDVTIVADGQPGTRAYMSPEQARGESVDERSDVYAVGACLFFAVTGEHLGDRRGSRDSPGREPPELDDERVPDALGGVLARAMAGDPEDRYDSARSMQAALVGCRPRLGAPTPRPEAHSSGEDQ